MYIKKSTTRIICGAMYLAAILLYLKFCVNSNLSEKDQRFIDGVCVTLFVVSSILAGIFELAPDE